MAFKKKSILFWLVMFSTFNLNAQTGKIIGKMINEMGVPIESVQINIEGTNKVSYTDKEGNYLLDEIPYGNCLLLIKHLGYTNAKENVLINNSIVYVNTSLTQTNKAVDEVVISGTMKEVSKLDSPVPIEIYTAKFFKSNPTPSLFDALQNINGVRPQLNCNICNTGDIHINGLEGPYTMILIDGMPIVSGLSTVYGLSGIPQSLIERIEIVKGPASTLYGSEAVGGLINVITKNLANTPPISFDVFSTSWGEVNTDIASKINVGKRVQSLLGINYFNYQNAIDKNKDNFTDVTLQNRVSIFNKWNIERNENRIFTLAARYIYEDRWGGEVNWGKKYRGGEEVYAESIYTNRWELFGNYQLPVKEKIIFQLSTNGHNQNSVYGNMPYLADQYIGFSQLTWFKTIGSHDFLTGLTYRYTYYNDNTPATAKVSNTHLPGAFIQDEISFNLHNKILLGIRYDYNSIYGSIFTPRLNYKWSSLNKQDILRLSIGNGYRIANVFTEDHAALTGARDVLFINNLKPETSWNTNINFVKKISLNNAFIGIDATAFYTYFNNKIIADYEMDPNKIIYDNLSGHAISRGISMNLDIAFLNGLKILMGSTLMDVYSKQNNKKTTQLFTEKFTGVWNIGYTFKPIGMELDYTGNLYGPMRLPLLSDTDPRKPYSPWWSIQNIQITKYIGKNIEIYGGIKNLLNWTPNKGNPFIIARSNDPFDKEVQFDGSGKAIATPNNPYGLTFDPSYVYAPNQGIRGFLGFRYKLLTNFSK